MNCGRMTADCTPIRRARERVRGAPVKQFGVAAGKLPAPADPAPGVGARERHRIDRLGLGLEVVERGGRPDRIPECPMGCHIGDAFAVDIGVAPVAEARDMMLPRPCRNHFLSISLLHSPANPIASAPQEIAVDATMLAKPGCRQRFRPASGPRQQIDDNMRNVMQAWALRLYRGGSRAARIPERLRKASDLLCEDCGARGLSLRKPADRP
jgi:hypothetical protein